MGTLLKKIATRSKTDAVIERKVFRIWYIVNPSGNLAVRSNFKRKSRR